MKSNHIVISLIAALLALAIYQSSPVYTYAEAKKSKELNMMKLEQKELKKELERREKEYDELIKNGCPEAILERRRQDIEAFKEKLEQLNNPQMQLGGIKSGVQGSETNQTNERESNGNSDILNPMSGRVVPNEEITLTVVSDGPTKDDAVKNALRTAIEQAYGTFVSANTTILNDELVRDEIITVANGSIKEYRELSSAEKPEGGYSVTVNATVSLSHLISYAKNYGSECEFAGNTFGMEMKLFELQKKNEMAALENLSSQILALTSSMLEHKLVVGEPKVVSEDYLKQMFCDSVKELTPDGSLIVAPRLAVVYNNRVNSCAIRDDAAKVMQDFNSTLVREGFYEVPFEISWVSTIDRDKPVSPIMLMFYETLHSLSMPEKEFEAMKKRGLDVTGLPPYCGYYDPSRDEVRYLNEYLEANNHGAGYIALRNSRKDVDMWLRDFIYKLQTKFADFVILDNTGQKSHLWGSEFSDWLLLEENGIRKDGTHLILDYNTYYKGSMGAGLFQNPFQWEFNLLNLKNYDVYGVCCVSPDYPTQLKLGFKVYIPKSEIGKYSSFRIERNERACYDD